MFTWLDIVIVQYNEMYHVTIQKCLFCHRMLHLLFRCGAKQYPSLFGRCFAFPHTAQMEAGNLHEGNTK